MRHIDGIPVTDPLAIPLEQAPSTIDYLTWLRQEAEQSKNIDPGRCLALVERGAILAQKLAAHEHLVDFLFKRVWYHREIDSDYAAARSDLRAIENLLDSLAHSLSHNLADTVRMRCDYHYGAIYGDEGAFEEARRHLLAGLERARQSGDTEWQAEFHNDLAGLYEDVLGDTQLQFDHLQAALRLCPREVCTYTTLLFNLAQLSHHCEDYATARAYLNEALSIGTPNMRVRSRMLAMASALCMEEGNPDAALSWADLAVEAAREQDVGTMVEALDSRAFVQFEQGNLAESIQDLEEAHALALAVVGMDMDTHTLACQILCSLSRVLSVVASGNGNVQSAHGLAAVPADKARAYLVEAEAMLPTVLEGHKSACLLLIARAKNFLGDYRGAYQAIEERDELRGKQRLGKVRTEISSMRLLMKLEREEHEKEIHRLKAEQAEKQLSNTTLQLLAQTELLRDLRSDLQKIIRKIPPTEPVGRELRDRIKNLPCESVDWKKFDRQFEAAHPEFIRKLTERAADLTPTEVRVCTMVRMNLKSHEIASLFCITEEGVEFHRRNIRRKLGLRKEEKLPIVLGGM